MYIYVFCKKFDSTLYQLLLVTYTVKHILRFRNENFEYDKPLQRFSFTPQILTLHYILKTMRKDVGNFFEFCIQSCMRNMTYITNFTFC